MHKFRVIVVAGALLLMLPLLSTAAAATPQWTPPEVLGSGAESFSMDVNAAGDAVAVWRTPQGMKASYRPAGSDWQNPVVLDEKPGVLVDAFIDDRGQATAVWARDARVSVADRGGDGRWRLDTGAPVTGATCCSVGIPTAAADAEGNLIVTWSEWDDTVGTSTYFFWRSPGGRWTAEAPGGGSYFYPISLRAGVARVVNAQGGNVSVETRRQGSVGTRGTIWSGANLGSAVIAENSRGDRVIAVLDGGDPGGVMNAGDPGELVVLTRPVGQPWRRVFVGEDEVVTYPSVAISEQGQVAASYVRAADSGVEVRMGNVEGTENSPPQAFGAVAHMPASVEFNPQGDAAITWSSADVDTLGPVYAARRPAGGDWSQRVLLAEDALAVQPQVRAYPNGMFTAVFGDQAAAWWSDYVNDDAAPHTTMRAPAKAHALSTRIRVRWSATDALSRPDSVDVRLRSAGRAGDFGSWRMWRRSTAASSAVFVGKPGRTYCFAARSRDRVGNLGAWSTARCTSTPVDDRSFASTGGWNRVENRGAYLSTLSTTNTVGHRLRLPGVRAASLRLLARTCASCGTVRISHAGRSLGTFDLVSRQPRNRVIRLRSYQRPQMGAVVIRVVGKGPVRIDGLAWTR